ncbi:MAG TPA: FAD-dependent oxidoreductase [Nocardioidaceae bacterium]|nr:FAD-dependent oxidoreductase [Nocardioidaceae bacterium]
MGSGVAGLTAAHLLRDTGDVVLYEADRRLGGHADTHAVDLGDGRTVAVDTGFIVHNDRTYPTLCRLFEQLGVATQESDMSMSVRCVETGLEYAGARGARGLFAQPRNMLRPSYLKMLGEVPRFHRAARTLLAEPEADDGADQSLATFLRRGGYSPAFHDWFMTPLVAAVWSCAPDAALDYPARYLFRFLDHHGMLSVFGSPSWRTVVGGSKVYVDHIASGLDEVRLQSPVTVIHEHPDGVDVTDGTGHRDRFDAVVVATHPHQALAMLRDPAPVQRDVLSAMPYASNTALLHTDTSLLPRSDSARAAWNYLRRGPGTDHVVVSYDLTRLQRLDRGQDAVTDRRFVLTLGGHDLVDPAQVIEEMHYEHPIYNGASRAAQQRLSEIDTARIRFAGAYHGWGFHEDGARSGAAAATALGGQW